MDDNDNDLIPGVDPPWLFWLRSFRITLAIFVLALVIALAMRSLVHRLGI